MRIPISLTILKAEQRRINESIKTLDTQIRDLKKQIDDENRRLADIAGGDFARRRDEIAQRRAEAEAAVQDLQNHQEGLRDKEDAIREAERNVTVANAPLKKQSQEIEQAEALLKSLSRDRGHANSGFSEKMPHLLSAIAREKSFNQRPIGPVAHHVRLKKPEWSAVIEQSLNSTLNSFIVTSKRDMNILLQIMQRVQWYDAYRWLDVSLSLIFLLVSCQFSLEVTVPSIRQQTSPTQGLRQY